MAGRSILHIADRRDRTSVEEIAEDAFAMFNDAPRDEEGHALARQYRQCRLRSLSFPRKVTVLPGVVLPSPKCWVALD
jgi:hypothetical protein